MFFVFNFRPRLFVFPSPKPAPFLKKNVLLCVCVFATLSLLCPLKPVPLLVFIVLHSCYFFPLFSSSRLFLPGFLSSFLASLCRLSYCHGTRPMQTPRTTPCCLRLSSKEEPKTLHPRSWAPFSRRNSRGKTIHYVCHVVTVLCVSFVAVTAGYYRTSPRYDTIHLLVCVHCPFFSPVFPVR